MLKLIIVNVLIKKKSRENDINSIFRNNLLLVNTEISLNVICFKLNIENNNCLSANKYYL